MAKRRMFNKEVIETDWFTDMPATTQLLYIHLSMEADDEGFVTSTKTALMNAHATRDDLAILKAKNYIIELEQGLYLFKHWKQNNYIQKDRYSESPYHDRLVNFSVKDDGSYTQCDKISNVEKINIVNSEEEKPLINTNCGETEPNVYKMDTECIQNVYTGKYSIGKYSIGKDSIEKEKENNIKEIKRYKTLLKQPSCELKQKALCALLVEKNFIPEDDLQDSAYDDLLDEYAKQYGYTPTKITLNYVLEHISDTAKGSINYLKKAMEDGLERYNKDTLKQLVEACDDYD